MSKDEDYVEDEEYVRMVMRTMIRLNTPGYAWLTTLEIPKFTRFPEPCKHSRCPVWRCKEETDGD